MRNAEAPRIQTAREMLDRDWFVAVTSEEGGRPGVEGEGPEADAGAFGEGHACVCGDFVVAVTLVGNEVVEGFDGVGVVEEGVRVTGGVEGAGVEGGEEGLLGGGGGEEGGGNGGGKGDWSLVVLTMVRLTSWRICFGWTWSVVSIESD